MAFSGFYCLFLTVMGLCRSSFQANPECTDVRASSTATFITSHETYGTDNYPSWRDVCWTVVAHGDSKIIEITRQSDDLFQIQYGTSECIYDNLLIEDLSTANGQTLNLCGHNTFSVLYSPGNIVRIRFTTDGSETCLGFRLFLKEVDSSNYTAIRWNSGYYFYGYSPGGCTDVPTSIDLTRAYIGISIGIVLGAVLAAFALMFACFVFYNYKKSTKVEAVELLETGPRIPGNPRRDNYATQESTNADDNN